MAWKMIVEPTPRPQQCNKFLNEFVCGRFVRDGFADVQNGFATSRRIAVAREVIALRGGDEDIATDDATRSYRPAEMPIRQSDRNVAGQIERNNEENRGIGEPRYPDKVARQHIAIQVITKNHTRRSYG